MTKRNKVSHSPYEGSVTHRVGGKSNSRAVANTKLGRWIMAKDLKVEEMYDSEIMETICDLLNLLGSSATGGGNIGKVLNELGMSEREHDEVIRRFAGIGGISEAYWECLLLEEDVNNATSN